MNFWYDGFPVVHLQLGADAGMAYWYDGFPIALAADAVASDGAFVFVTATPVWEMAATVAPLDNPTRMTQMGRQVPTKEAAPFARLTQMGRNVPTKEAAPFARMTQMARQVVYPFTCEGGGGGGGEEACPDTLTAEPATGDGCGTTLQSQPV